MAETLNGVDATRRSHRSGTNKRRLNGLVGVRFETTDHVQALNAHAQRLGFKNAQELILARLQDDMAAVTKELAS